MTTPFIIVWGIALAIIAVLLAILAVTFRQNTHKVGQAEQVDGTAFVPSEDTLLFYYEKQGVRKTESGRVMIHIRDVAWDASWQDDLLRVKVSTQDPSSVVLGEAWRDAHVLAAYDLEAYRMTEMGTDLPVPSFVEPVDVFLFTDARGVDLDILTLQEQEWVSVSRSKTELEELSELADNSLPDEMDRAVASLLQLDRLFLVESSKS
jgi:hypothetical protein